MLNKIFALHANLLKSLSNATRLEIIQLLRHGELNVTDLHSMLSCTQSSISQHLRILKGAGVIKSKRTGKEVYYSIADNRFLEASDIIRDYLISSLAKKDQKLARDFTDSMTILEDPVCNMPLSPTSISFEHYFEGKKYYFCASGCQAEFIKHPKVYLNV